MKSVPQEIVSLFGSAAIAPRDKFRLIDFLSSKESADLLVRMALNEGLAGILYKDLLNAGAFEALASEHRQTLQSCYYRTLKFNLTRIHDLKQILTRTSRCNIQPVVIQGVDLLLQVYHDIGLRPVSDIDLWVLDTDFQEFTKILHGLNYVQDPLYPLTFKKGSTTLDLHRHLLWADRIKARQHLLSKDQNHIYQDTRLIEVDGLMVRCLGRYDRIIYLGLHLLKHNAERLIWLVDVKKLLSDWTAKDWERLLNRAREMGQEKCVAYICFLLKLLFRFSRPEQLCPQLKKIRLNSLEKKLLTLRKKKSLPEWSTLILFSSGKGLVKGMSFFMETLFPRAEILRQVFSDHSGSSIPRLYAKRTRQLFLMLINAIKPK